MQKIKKIAIKTLKILFLTIVGLHLTLRITAFFEPFFTQLLYLTNPLFMTEYYDERFTHEKWMNIKIGTHKSEVEKIIKGKDYPNSGHLDSSIAIGTYHSYQKNGYCDYRVYNFYYDKNQILIRKFYYWIYE